MHHRADDTLKYVSQELRQQAEAITTMSKQTTSLRHLPLDVATLQAEFGNVAAQLPTGQ